MQIDLMKTHDPICTTEMQILIIVCQLYEGLRARGETPDREYFLKKLNEYKDKNDGRV